MSSPVRLFALAATAAFAACAVAAAVPGADVVGDVAMAVAELAAAALMWVVGGRRRRGARGWRLLSVALVVPVAWALVALGTAGGNAVVLAYFSWAPTIPAYLLAITASLTFPERAQLRSGGPRLAVEVVLFTTAVLVAVQMLVLGPDGGWGSLTVGLRATLATAVVTMSASMAVGLILLGVIEARRQRMALCLLAGSVLMSLGQGLGASLALAGVTAAVDASRFLVVAGMVALSGAALVDPGRSPDAAERARPASGSWTRFRQMAPYVAMVVAMLVVVAASLAGHRPDGTILTGVVIGMAMVAVHRWLTAREEERVRGLLQRSEAYFRSLVRSSSDGVVIVDHDLRITWTSPALDWALAPAATPLAGRSLVEVVHPDDAPAVAAALSAAAHGPETVDREDPHLGGLLLLRLQDADGQWRYLEAGVSDVRRDADVGAVVLHCRDMTERHAREQALQSVAYTDPMTGLPNRAGFLRLVGQALPLASAEPATLLVIELDGLAAARENAGREIVSTVVAEVGRRLRATVRGEDVVARMGGGAFAVLAEGTDADSDRLAARCLSVVEQPILTPAGIVDLTSGVGLVALEEGLDVDALLARGDLAVRAAHAAGLGTARRYHAGLGDAAARRDRLRHDLQGAQARGELALLFQPIVSLEQQRITGIEAQLRWQHAELGEVPPEEFLALAERAGLIGELLRWAVEETVCAVAGLPEREDPLRVGVKIPFGYLATGSLVGDVEQALERSGLAPERLVLQINAPAVTSEDERIALDVASLRLMGVHVALDGFGSGSSALAHLTRLPIDILRLDRALITRIDRDPQSRALCESIVGIGRALGVDVVADGVETPAQLAALCGFGCGFAQGFLFARPLSLAGFASMFAETEGFLWPGLVGSSSR